jgi:hypothetical protein
MPYIINKTNGEPLLTLEDGTLNDDYSVGLLGKNTIGYGEVQNENFIHLLENFAGISPPSGNILTGQVYYNTENKQINVYDGSQWKIVGDTIVHPKDPTLPIADQGLGITAPSRGTLWLNSTTQQLFVYNSGWKLIGPEAVENFGTTRAVTTVLIDTVGTTHPVVQITINNAVIAICSSTLFTIANSNAVNGFSVIKPGITMSTTVDIKGNVDGNSLTATRLQNSRLINGQPFDGSSDITITASASTTLTRGEYLLGDNFNGSAPTTWSVDATTESNPLKIVVRDSQGDFSARTVTANLIGNVTGNVSSTTGTSQFNDVVANSFIGNITGRLTGLASEATKLRTPRTINGVLFDGTANITVVAESNTLIGTQLAENITRSSLTSVGTLVNLNVNNDIRISPNNSLYLSGGTSRDGSINGKESLTLSASGNFSTFGNLVTQISILSPGETSLLGGYTPGTAPGAIIPSTAIRGGTSVNLGAPTFEFNEVHANRFIGSLTGNATSSNFSPIAGKLQFARSINGVLFDGTSNVTIKSSTTNFLNRGTYLTGNNFDGSAAVTWAVDATSTNTAGKVVARDNTGNFSANTITASLIGNVSGNLTGNVSGNLNGTTTGTHVGNVIGNVSGNVTGSASSNVLKTGDTMTGDINWTSTGRGLNWAFNTDGASIRFYNIGDGDVDSRLEFETKDNNNEYFRWSHTPSGGTNYESMRLVTAGPNNATLTVKGRIVAEGSMSASAFTGDGSAITSLNASQLTTGTISSERLSGTYPINVSGSAASNVAKSGDSMSGYLTLVGAPVNANHAATKAYVDASAGYVFTFGQTASTSGFTNQVGSWNFNRNHFDIFPPAGRSMGNLVGFIPSIAVIHYAGGVDGNDSLVCTYAFFGDRIRVYVQNTEQRSTPAANWLCIWR